MAEGDVSNVRLPEVGRISVYSGFEPEAGCKKMCNGFMA